MRVEVLPNFISTGEAAVLNNFALESVSKGSFSEGVTSKLVNPPGTQMISRFNCHIKFPELALQLQKKLCISLGLTENYIHRMFHPTGIVVNCTFNGAQVVPHKDPSHDSLSLLRCNLISSKAESGGVLVVEDAKFDVPELGVYFCLVSEHTHSVTKVEGNKPRIIWQFGFDVLADDWNSGKIKVQQ